MKYLTLTPAHGRDYKSSKEVKEAFEAGRDFLVADLFSNDDGRAANKHSFIKERPITLNIRFKQLRNIAQIVLK